MCYMNNFKPPAILECSKFVASGTSINERIVRDYEFDFYLGGERDIYIDEKNYKISKGCMVFKKPGQFTSGNSDYNMYMLTLDFSYKCEIPHGKYIRSSSTVQQENCDIGILNEIPSVFIPYHQEELKKLFKILCNNSYPNIVNTEVQNQTLTELLLLLLADAFRYKREYSSANRSEKSYVEKACNYINQNYYKEITLSALAENLSLNKSYLVKLFKNELQTTPNQYIKQTRLFYAERMLIQTDLTVENICFSCGFNTPSYFIKCFKENFGKSPLEYRNTHT